MGSINRLAALIIPRDPFLEWMKLRDFPVDAQDCFKEWRDDPNTYLLAENVRGSAVILRDNWEVLFESELFAWSTDESSWPPNRSLQMFKEWFEIYLSSLVVDLVDDFLVDEDAVDAL